MNWLKQLFSRPRLYGALSEEIREHLDEKIEELVAGGMSRTEAGYVARREFGNLSLVEQDSRKVWRWTALEDLFADIRYGLRMLRRNPGFTAVAVLTLALGIGATTAIFTVVKTVLLRALPYPDSERIVNISRFGVGSSVPMFTYWERNNPGFEDLAAYTASIGMNLDDGDKVELAKATKASRDYFRLFGANPLLGRTFTEEEDRAGGPRVLVMSYGLWQRRFGGEPSIVGKAITLGGASHTVVGVLSPQFRPEPPTDVWVPLQADANSTDQAHVLTVCGRLPSGATLAVANSWMAVIGKRYVETHPEQLGNDDKIQVTFLRQHITGDTQPALLLLLGAVGFVLLIACANVANLLLARAMGRQREIAVRSAIGAGRGRIARQLLTESLLLGLAGGGLGLLLGSWGVRALLALTPGNLPRVQEMASVPGLDPWIAGLAILLALVTGVLFGLFPAAQLWRTELAASLQQSSGRTGAGPTHNRTRGMLVAAEVAIAVPLLCGALLLVRSFAAMHNVSLGFDAHNLLTMEVSLAGSGYSKSSEVDRLARQFVERAERIPGVESAAVANSLPLWGTQDMIFDIPGRAPLKEYKFTGDVQWRFVTAHYFDVLRIPLLSGRLLRDEERGKTVVINQMMARQFWPNANPVGQSIFIGPGLGPTIEEGLTEIVGVVGDVRERLNADAPPTMYQSPLQIPDAAMVIVNGLQSDAILVRTRPGVAPMSVSENVQQALVAGDKLPATKVRTMEQAGLNSTERQNFNLLLLGLFATMALLLAAVGIYGVMSYSVEQRNREIGIRAVLGANRGEIIRLVLIQALRMTLIGVAIGIAASLGLTRLLSAQLFGVKPSDPVTYIAVPSILLATAIAAAVVPAWRAIRVDPMVALRNE
jgi:putative ABC transport system permease protein